MYLSRQSLSVGDMPTLAKEFYCSRPSTSTCLDSLLLDDTIRIESCQYPDYRQQQQQQPVDLAYLMEVHRILTDLDRVLDNNEVTVISVTATTPEATSVVTDRSRTYQQQKSENLNERETEKRISNGSGGGPTYSTANRTSYHDSPKIHDRPPAQSATNGHQHQQNAGNGSEKDSPVPNRNILTNGSLHSNTYVNNNNTANAGGGLDNMLNLSAAEMREKLSLRKKRDPRQANMSLQQKYEIARNL